MLWSMVALMNTMSGATIATISSGCLDIITSLHYNKGVL
jgi:hypothetical protein